MIGLLSVMALFVLPLFITACGGGTGAQIGDTVKVLYNGTFDNGSVFDSSEMHGNEPLEFTIGTGQVIPGFDQAVMGMSLNESKTVTIPAEEAYGQKYFEVDLSELPDDLEVGEKLYKQSEDGSRIEVTVVNISESTATLENVHPLAGEDLTFKITLVEIVE
jgi:peptidylprolyl isomerase